MGALEKIAKLRLDLEILKRRPAHKRADYQGIGVRIDRPKGFVQTGTGDDGKAWSRTYKTDYGYVPKTEGGDGDELDVYLGPDPGAAHAHWIVQRKSGGAFDEFKLMLGFPDLAAAQTMWADHTPAKFYGGAVTTDLALVKSLLGVHPGEGPSGISKAEDVQPAITAWLDARALLEDDDLHLAAAILKSADDAIAGGLLDLFDAKLAAFDRSCLEGAQHGESRAIAVARVFGVDPVAKSEWSTSSVNDLPDSAFLYVEPGGTRDADGRTTPRALRHFPYRGPDGHVDLPHLRNALARIPQAAISPDEKDKLTAEAQRLLEQATKADETSAALDAGGKLQAEQGRSRRHHDEDPLAAIERAFDRYLGPELASELRGRTVKLAPSPAPTGAGEELRYVLGIVLEPDVTDAQDDTYDAATIREAAWDYLANARNRGLQHRVLVNDGVDIVESYCAPCDMNVGDRAIKAGTWLLGWRVLDDAIWSAIKAGKITGFSIGGWAQRTPIAA